MFGATGQLQPETADCKEGIRDGVRAFRAAMDAFRERIKEDVAERICEAEKS